MKNNWKTSLDGAISITGTTLIGVGVITTQTSIPSKVIVAITVLGFVLSALGKGITALFAADASTVQNVAAAVDKINALGSDPGQPPSLTKPPFPDNQPAKVP